MLNRTNRWALGALLDRSIEGRRRQGWPMYPSQAAFAREVDCGPGTLIDVASGRRDASLDLLVRMAAALDEDPRALAVDPFDILPLAMAVADSARELVPHLNGGDFGLAAALAELDAALAGNA